MTRWIEHLVEPRKLILAWGPPEYVEDRTHWAVGELSRVADDAEFRYFSGLEFEEMNNGRTAGRLRETGFRGYPAFAWSPTGGEVFRSGVLGAFQRRLPSPQREDFAAYLERFYLRPRAGLSSFALLSAPGAFLPNDGFSLIDPLDGNVREQDVLLEVNGYRHYDARAGNLATGSPAILVAEPDHPRDQFAVRIELEGKLIGYVSRVQSRSASQWLGRAAVEAWLARVNGSAAYPRAFIFVAVRARELRPAA